MVVSPRHEASLFHNRDKFDLVVVYDGSSTSFGAENTPLSVLVRAIFERAFRKMLKRTPMLLVGGLEAWKRDIGDSELVRGSGYVEIQRPVPTKDQTSPLLANGVSSNVTGDTWSPRTASIPGHHITMSMDQSGHSRHVGRIHSPITTLIVHFQITCRLCVLRFICVKWWRSSDSPTCRSPSKFQLTFHCEKCE